NRRLERQFRAETEDRLVVVLFREQRDAEVQRDGNVAELRNVDAQTSADGNAILVEADIIGDGAAVEEQHARKSVAEERELILRAKEELPLAADGFIAGKTVVGSNALGADGAVIESAE